MTPLSFNFGRSSRVGAVIALAALTLLVPGVLAQTPEGEATPADGAQVADGPHPAHIHTGTCDSLGDVVLPLTDVEDPTAGEERVGPASAHPVKTSRTTVDMPLEEIVEGGHAVNVHLSADEIGTYIACGDIGGAYVTDEDGRTHLLIGLGELNDSGHAGVVWLGEDGDQTEVAITLIEPEEMS